MCDVEGSGPLERSREREREARHKTTQEQRGTVSGQGRAGCVTRCVRSESRGMCHALRQVRPRGIHHVLRQDDVTQGASRVGSCALELAGWIESVRRCSYWTQCVFTKRLIGPSVLWFQ